MSVETLAQALLEAGILDAGSVGMRVPRARSGRILLDNIVGDGLATETSLVNQLARALSVPRYDPKERSPEPEALALLDPRSADELGVLPVAVRGGGALLWVALCDPTDEQLLGEIARRTGRRVKACLIGPRELTRALQAISGNAPPTPKPPPQSAYPAPQTGPSGQYRAAPMPQNLQPAPMPQSPQPQMQMQPQYAGQMPYGMPGMMNGLSPGMTMNGMPGQGYPAYGYPAGMMPGLSMPTPMAMPAAPGRTPDLQKLEEELAQAKQVVKVLAQLLVERGVIDGEELKRRLRAERERKSAP